MPAYFSGIRIYIWRRRHCRICASDGWNSTSSKLHKAIRGGCNFFFNFLKNLKLIPLTLQEQKIEQTPEEKSSFLSKIFFCWLNPLIRAGAKQPLTNESLHNLNENATSEWLYTRWRAEFDKEKAGRSEFLGNFCMFLKNLII